MTPETAPDVEESNDLQETPIWTWVLVGACVFIPITSIGGLIPSMLGAGGAVSVLSLARNTKQTDKQRILLSFGATLLVWCLYVGFSFAMQDLISDNKTTTRPQPVDLSDETLRKQVFSSVAASLASIDATHKKIIDVRRQSKDASFYRERLARQEESHARRRAFAAKFHRISIGQVDAIINEGVAESWPLK